MRIFYNCFIKMGITTDKVMELTANSLGLQIKNGKNDKWYVLWNKKTPSQIINVFVDEQTGKLHCSSLQEEIDKCFSESAKNLLRTYYAEIVY